MKPSRHAKQKKSVSAKSAYANTSKTTKRNSPPKKPNSSNHYKTTQILPNHNPKSAIWDKRSTEISPLSESNHSNHSEYSEYSECSECS